LNQDECQELNRLIDEYGERVGHLTRAITAARSASAERAAEAQMIADRARFHAEQAWAELERHVAEHHPEHNWAQLGVEPIPPFEGGQ